MTVIRHRDVPPTCIAEVAKNGGACVQGHWIGCLYYGLAAYNAFDMSLFRLNWVDAWVQQSFSDFNWLESSATYDYVVSCAYSPRRTDW